jgi:hypothetical protein
MKTKITKKSAPKSFEQVLLDKYSKLTPEQREIHITALHGAEAIWRVEDRKPWSKPQHTKPVGHTPLGERYRRTHLYNDDCRDELEGMYANRAMLDAEENIKNFTEKLNPKELAEMSLSDELEFDSVKGDVIAASVAGKQTITVLDENERKRILGEKHLAEFKANMNDTKLPVKKFTLTTQELETLFAETQRNLEIARAEEFAAKEIDREFWARVLKPTTWDRIRAWFKR